jgi:hypothetical protein
VGAGVQVAAGEDHRGDAARVEDAGVAAAAGGAEARFTPAVVSRPGRRGDPAGARWELALHRGGRGGGNPLGAYDDRVSARK